MRRRAAGIMTRGRKLRGAGETERKGAWIPCHYHCTAFDDSATFLGRPRGRIADSRPNCSTTCSVHASSPNGHPRLTLRRIASSSIEDCGSFTKSTQSAGRSTGQSLSIANPRWLRCLRQADRPFSFLLLWRRARSGATGVIAGGHFNAMAIGRYSRLCPLQERT